jgi:putative SOS response-associated peptidase YedK
MCYFVEINLSRLELEKHYNLPMPEDPRYTPGYFHSAFTKPWLPVITNENSMIIQVYRWGLIPSWVRTYADAEKQLSGTFNARGETIWDKPSFRSSAKSRRCLVLSHGFFEYHTSGKQKIPYYIRRKDNLPISFAGLYELWTDKASGEIIPGFSIVTTEANPLLQRIHNTKKRMPVILNSEDETKWIDSNLGEKEIKKMIKPLTENILVAWEVSKDKIRNKTNAQDSSLLEAVGNIFNDV